MRLEGSGQHSAAMGYPQPSPYSKLTPHTPLYAVPSSRRALGWHPWVLAAPEGWGFLAGAGRRCCPGHCRGWEVQVGRGHPQAGPRVWAPLEICTTPSRDGGFSQPHIASPTVTPRGRDGATLWPRGVVGGQRVPWAPVGATSGHPGAGAGGAPHRSPGGHRTLCSCLGGRPWVWGAGGIGDAGCWLLLLCAPRGAGDREGGGGPGGPGRGSGSRCSPDPLPGSEPLSSPRADINSSVFPFPKFPR